MAFIQEKHPPHPRDGSTRAQGCDARSRRAHGQGHAAEASLPRGVPSSFLEYLMLSKKVNGKRGLDLLETRSFFNDACRRALFKCKSYTGKAAGSVRVR